MTTTLRDPHTLAELERASATLATSTAGKITAEFNLKDGLWSLGTVTVLIPHHRRVDETPPKA